MKVRKIIARAFAAIILAVVASGTASAASVEPYWSNYASWSSTPSGTYTANYGDSVMLTVWMV